MQFIDMISDTNAASALVFSAKILSPSSSQTYLPAASFQSKTIRDFNRSAVSCTRLHERYPILLLKMSSRVQSSYRSSAEHNSLNTILTSFLLIVCLLIYVSRGIHLMIGLILADDASSSFDLVLPSLFPHLLHLDPEEIISK